MPMPDVSGACTNDSSELRTASHLVVGLGAAGSESSIEPDRSSITYMSSSMASAWRVSPRQPPESRALGEPLLSPGRSLAPTTKPGLASGVAPPPPAAACDEEASDEQP